MPDALLATFNKRTQELADAADALYNEEHRRSLLLLRELKRRHSQKFSGGTFIQEPFIYKDSK